MEIKSQKKLALKFYIVSLILNMIVPLIASYIIVNDEIGEIKLLLVAAIIWGLGNALIYSFYFLIPQFCQNWEKIAGLFFPSIMIFAFCLFDFFNIYLLLIYTLILNLIFVLFWMIKKRSEKSS